MGEACRRQSAKTDTIAEIEAQQEALTTELSSPELYQETPERAGQINEELAALEQKLEELFERWDTLAAKRAESES